MADNYLENQFEQYQARKAAWEREKKLGKRKAHPATRPTADKAAPAENATPDTGTTPPSCVDCGTQNCKYKTKTYPELTSTPPTGNGHWSATTKGATTTSWWPAPKSSTKAIANGHAWRKSCALPVR